jgi:hypothetical protein
VARDKRMRRAEARRRHRDQLRAEPASQASGPIEPIEQGPAEKGRSLLSGFGLGLPDVGTDLRVVPGIARHTFAFLLPTAAILAAFVLALDPSVFRLQNQPGDPTTVVAARSVFQFVLLPPPITAVFVASVLAPRAGWLVGGLIGLLATVAFLVLLGIHGPTDYFSLALTPTIAGQTVATYLPIYVLIGAFAGYYRRFLMGMQARTRQRADEKRKSQAREAKRARTAPARR